MKQELEGGVKQELEGENETGAGGNESGAGGRE